MQIIIKLSNCKPTVEQLHQIINMIAEGYNEGIDQPVGVTHWKLELKGKGTYEYIQSLEEEN